MKMSNCPICPTVPLSQRSFFWDSLLKKRAFHVKDVFLPFLPTFCPCVITVWDSGTLITVNALLNKVYPSFFAWDTLGTIGTVMLEVPPCQ
jgi:hypothetical protein